MGSRCVKRSRRLAVRREARLLPLAFLASILPRMSFRKAGGEWEPMLLGIEPRNCGVCGKGLYRNFTLLRGGWSRCTVCGQFVHYSCLSSGKTKFLKVRPRVCKTCRQNRDRPLPKEGGKLAVGS